MRNIIIAGLFISVALAVFISPCASQQPDGLEKVAEDKGFIEKSEGKEVFRAPIPDYTLPGIKSKTVATSLAGLLGTLIVAGITFGIGYLWLRWRRRRE